MLYLQNIWNQKTKDHFSFWSFFLLFLIYLVYLIAKTLDVVKEKFIIDDDSMKHVKQIEDNIDKLEEYKREETDKK